MGRVCLNNYQSPRSQKVCYGAVSAAFLLSSLALGGVKAPIQKAPVQPPNFQQKFEGELVDRVVAIVNSEPILHGTIQDKVDLGTPVKVSAYPSLPQDSNYKKALNDEINLQLVLGYGINHGIEVPEEEVEKQIQLILDNNRLSLDRLKQELAREGKTLEAYREDIHNQMFFMRFRGRVLIPRVVVTEKTVESEFMRRSGGADKKVTLKLKQVFLPAERGESELQKMQRRKKAEAAYSDLKGGASFEQVEKLYPGPGELSVRLGDLSPEIQRKVASLAEGEFSRPVELAGGTHIFYLREKVLSKDQDYLKQKKQLELELRNQELIQQMQLWIGEERRKSNIKLLS